MRLMCNLILVMLLVVVSGCVSTVWVTAHTSERHHCSISVQETLAEPCNQFKALHIALKLGLFKSVNDLFSHGYPLT
jgi:hypothetical protein